MSDTDLVYLSLGAGVQSSAMLVCSALGLHGHRKADVAVFADTGDEPPWVYDMLAELTDFGARYGIPVERIERGGGSLSQQTKGRSMIPFYIGNGNGREGMLRRKCSSEFKLEPIEKFARKALGYAPRQRVTKHATAMIGISIDEALRMKPARFKWLTNTYPLVDACLTREACLQIVLDHGLPHPEKSACVFCPYHSDRYWHWMKTVHPETFAEAVAFDNTIRDMSAAGVRQPAYVHRSCVPLGQVEFNIGDPFQVDMFYEECEGICGV